MRANDALVVPATSAAASRGIVTPVISIAVLSMTFDTAQPLPWGE